MTSAQGSTYSAIACLNTRPTIQLSTSAIHI